MTDIYELYCDWHLKFYRKPYDVSREEWNRWGRIPVQPLPTLSDIDFDTAEERRAGWTLDGEYLP